jgi:hypothetical protein
MKIIIIISLLFTLGFNQVKKVYICRSGTSYAYHARVCQGLGRCTHKIEYVTLEEAKASGHKKPCGYCFK